MTINPLKRRVQATLVAATVLLGVAGLESTPAHASTWMPDRIGVNQLVRDRLVSSNGCYVLAVQGDGNLVIYKRYGDGHSIWASGIPALSGSSYYLVYQSDGNLVEYTDGTFNSGPLKNAYYRYTVWASNTFAVYTPPGYVVMQSDGNLVMYNGWGTAVWSTRSNQSPLPANIKCG